MTNEDAERIEKFRPLITNLCSRFLPLGASRDDVSDLVQETVFNTARGLARFRGDSNIKSWLYRVAYNTVVTHYRSRKNRDSIPSEPKNNSSSNGVEHYPDHPGLHSQSVEDRIIRKIDTHRALRKELPNLEYTHRQAFVLRHLIGYSYKEIADILRISENIAKSRVHRAKEKLSAVLVGGSIPSRTQKSLGQNIRRSA